jgi:hypothetical protein
MGNIIDLDIDGSEKQKFRIAKDDNRIIELDLSDTNILVRLNAAIPIINNLSKKWDDLSVAAKDASNAFEDDTELSENAMNHINKFSNAFEGLEKDLREQINYIFDYDVCTPIAQNRSLFDVHNGIFRYEQIVDKLTDLYEKSIKDESENIRKRMTKHTNKYLKK